jgi:uncharacterized protein YbgA (DUF1722 family)
MVLSKNTYLSCMRSVPDNTPAFDDAVVSSYWHADQTQATLLAVDVRGYMKPSVVIAKKRDPAAKEYPQYRRHLCFLSRTVSSCTNVNQCVVVQNYFRRSFCW